jgi:NAD(P)-dependent dehydrogenase (short-subunit alcohol dehydrogenase family)
MVRFLYRNVFARASGPNPGLRFEPTDVLFFLTVIDLAQKIVLVTGASGGLGRALAHAFAAQNCRVVITARDQKRLDAAAEALARKRAQVIALSCDIRSRDQTRRLAEEVVRLWGTVQVLINNAGIARAVNFPDMPDELWDDTVATNLTGAYNCCKVFLPAMLRAKWGRIINIASTAAKAGFRHASAYTASKHGLLGLTRSLALETARHGITVNAICPGYVDDERTRENASIMAEKTGKPADEILKLFAASAPQDRLIAPDEVASLALLMASEKLGGMTGQAVNVDGGAVMA